MRPGRLIGSASRRFDLNATQLGSQMIQHAVDVGVAVFGAEALHRSQRLVDDDAVRHVLAVGEFIGGDAQRGALDRVDLVDAAVEVRRERGVEGLSLIHI